MSKEIFLKEWKNRVKRSITLKTDEELKEIGMTREHFAQYIFIMQSLSGMVKSLKLDVEQIDNNIHANGFVIEGNIINNNYIAIHCFEDADVENSIEVTLKDNPYEVGALVRIFIKSHLK